MGFYGSNDQTNSVKALKEVVVLRIAFNPSRSTPPCYNPTHACIIHTRTTVLRPFFWDHPGEPVPEQNFWILWCKGRLTEADTHNTVIHKKHTHKNESQHSEMGPVRQNPIQRTVRSVHVCALHCAQLLHTILYRTDLIIFPFTLQTIIIALMMSIWEGGRYTAVTYWEGSQFTAQCHQWITSTSEL